MIDTQILLEIQNDCQILLDRAFLKKHFAAYGIDGFGQYGTSDKGKMLHCMLVDINMLAMNIDSDLKDVMVRLMFDMPFDQLGKSSDGLGEEGYVVTDKNLELSINSFLRAEVIPTRCWEWGTLEQQPRYGVTLYFKLRELLQW